MKNARVLAVVALIAGGVGTPVAIQQIAERERMEAAALQAEVEDVVIDAAYALKELGRSPAQVRDELSQASGVSPATVEALAYRSTLSAERDPRAKRSKTVDAVVPAAKVDEVAAAVAAALCEPLALVAGLSAAHAECLRSRSVLDSRPLCEGETTVGAAAHLLLTPPQEARVRLALAPLVEVTDQIEARLLTSGWWYCGSSPPEQVDPPSNPNLSAP